MGRFDKAAMRLAHLARAGVVLAGRRDGVPWHDRCFSRHLGSDTNSATVSPGPSIRTITSPAVDVHAHCATNFLGHCTDQTGTSVHSVGSGLKTGSGSGVGLW